MGKEELRKRYKELCKDKSLWNSQERWNIQEKLHLENIEEGGLKTKKSK